MSGGRSLQLELFLIWVICSLAMTKVRTANATSRCIESEKQALLNFKKGLVDEANLLSSWTTGEEDCCRWNRVGCDNHTGHVVMLDLRPAIYGDINSVWIGLGGKISSSLLELPYLSHLDLRGNSFQNIPDFIFSLSNLTYLDLSLNTIGKFPYQVGNLSMLQYLDLSMNYEMRVDSIEWFDHLSSLRVLNLSDINFSKDVDWLKSIKIHPSLSTLELAHCQFPEANHSSLSHVNSSKSLNSLRLTYNSFNSSIHSWLFNVSTALFDLYIMDDQLKGPIPEYFGEVISLVHLGLSSNEFEGGIPASFGNLCNLETLYVSESYVSGVLSDLLQNFTGCAKSSLEVLGFSGNQLKGSIPDISEFPSLIELYLDYNHLDGSFPERFNHFSQLHILNLEGNQLVGSLPDLSKFSFLTRLLIGRNKLNGSLTESIGKLSNLQILGASSNGLTGILSEAHLSNLSKLQELDLSYNSLSLKMSSNWVPTFQLDIIKLSSCKLGPQFPAWLQNQRNFSQLDISNCEISDAIPYWFWNFSSRLQYLNLSFNNIYGQVPNLSLKLHTFPAVDLSSNLFSGPIPGFLSNTTVLNLSNNMFMGSLSFLCTVPDSSLNYLDLSYNLLSGGLPDCWSQLKLLVFLNLESNDLFGTIPSSIGTLHNMKTLRLRNNSFTGELPASLKNCFRLELLDLGENKLTGKISAWIGERLTKLIVLRLRSNEFYGNIPSTTCHLSFIQVLDISFNNISGTIPACFNNFTAMALNQSSGNVISHQFELSYSYWNGSSSLHLPHDSAIYFDYALVIWRGIEQEYGKTLGLLKIIDLSSNSLTGEIPDELTSLFGIISLNLSRNYLTGAIPKRIGQLKFLESLDLSRNQLSGNIPTSLADISFLGMLDLSFNQLTGRIPTSTQLQSFNTSAYLGNPGLCGTPVLNDCPGDGKKHHPPSNDGTGNNMGDGEEWIDKASLYAGMGIGFAVGFWGIWGPLLINNSWRRAYFQLLNNIKGRMHSAISLRLARCSSRAMR